jgi:hypothetical protein
MCVCANCKFRLLHIMLNIDTAELLNELQPYVRREWRKSYIIWNIADRLQCLLSPKCATSNPQTLTLNRILLCQTKMLLYILTGILILRLKTDEHARYFSDVKHLLYATVKKLTFVHINASTQYCCFALKMPPGTADFLMSLCRSIFERAESNIFYDRASGHFKHELCPFNQGRYCRQIETLTNVWYYANKNLSPWTLWRRMGWGTIIVQRIHNRGHNCRWVASFALPSIYVPEEELPLTVEKKAVWGPEPTWRLRKKRKMPCPCCESIRHISANWTNSIVMIPTREGKQGHWKKPGGKFRIVSFN